MKVGTNAAVFILFFGMALLETIQERNWIKVALWLAIGVVFLLGDNIKLKANKTSMINLLEQKGSNHIR